MHMRVHVKFNQSVILECVWMCLMLDIYLPRIYSAVTLLHSEFLLFFFFCQHAKGGRVSYYRVATAPSIPMPGQNYGYEEDEERVLKPQMLPPRDTTMGPAYYDVTHVRVFV